MFDRDGNIFNSFQEQLKNLFPEEDLSDIEYNQVASETVTPA